MSLFKRKKPDTFPQYWESGKGVYHKWTSPTTFLKAVINGGQMQLTQQSLEHNTMAEILGKFTRIDKTKWDKFMEAVTLQNVDLYGARKLHYAFTTGGVNFYTFDGVDGDSVHFDLPVGRFQESQAAYHEMSSVADRAYLSELAGKGLEMLSGKDGNINLASISIALSDLQHRLKIGFDATAYERLFAVLYVTDDEDIGKWDPAYAQWKIEHVRKHGGDAFFFILAYQKLGAYRDFIRARFKDLYSEGKGTEGVDLSKTTGAVIQGLFHRISDSFALDAEIGGQKPEYYRLMGTYEWHEMRLRWIREGKLK